MPPPSAVKAAKKAVAKKAVAKKAVAKKAVAKKAVAKKAVAKKAVAKKAVAKKAVAKKAVAEKAVAKKAAAKKAAAKKAAQPTPSPAPNGGNGNGGHIPVRVRMYRQGLGDCFLLTFDPEGRKIHMLIDCGSLGAPTTNNQMPQVVAHIREATDDHLHLLVATHEHQDHVSGFGSRDDDFLAMKVDNVWMAWTENPADHDAQKLEVFKGQDLGEPLAMAANALIHNPTGDADATALGEGIHSLLGFIGEPVVLGAAKFATTVNRAMNLVRTQLTDSDGHKVTADYKEPGGPAIEPPWLPGFRFYVLGPPRNIDRLHEMGETGSPDIYGMAAGAAFHVARAAALKAAGDNKAGAAAATAAILPDEEQMPFDRRFRCSETDDLIRPRLDSYFDPKEAWRRIDTDWLHGAADLAMQLDKFTNNTSLALAIERISDGKVLLFPADAQQGNWLSWHEPPTPFTYTVNGVTHQTSAEKLLNETVFYKVGHHSSHNATGTTKGLVMMRRTHELVAFIPVDRKLALKRGGEWKMPANILYRNLLLQCEGRVARSDIGWAANPKNASEDTKEDEAPLGDVASDAEWAAWKANQANTPGFAIDPMFVEYTLS